jgi:hypothetical protein
MMLGLAAWVAGNLIGDKQGGTNIGLTLIGIGGGLAKQEGSTVKSTGNIESLTVEPNKEVN